MSDEIEDLDSSSEIKESEESIKSRKKKTVFRPLLKRPKPDIRKKNYPKGRKEIAGRRQRLHKIVEVVEEEPRVKRKYQRRKKNHNSDS